MKAFLFLLVGVVIGGFAMRAYDESLHPSAAERAKQAAGEVRGDLAERLRTWHLTGDDIKGDLERTGQVVRSKAAVVGDRIGDTRIAAVIKAKYILDRDLASRAIEVRVRDGEVTLSGTAASNELVGRAVALALDTDGVRHVEARLAVQPRGD